MKRPLFTLAVAIGLACCAAGTFAAETADLTINGTIRPAACNISLPTPEINFGTIPVSSLNATGNTALPTQTFDLLITCDGPAQVAIVGADNRAGTALGSSENNYGFGLLGDKPLGFYTMLPRDPMGDGEPAVNIVSGNEGATWRAQGAWHLDHNASSRITFAETGTLVPKAFATIQVPIELSAQVAAKNTLPALTEAVPLDGLATISLVYL